jgi:hypothetical protein
MISLQIHSHLFTFAVEPSFPICSIEEIDSELRSGLIRQKTLIFPTADFPDITQTTTSTKKK